MNLINNMNILNNCNIRSILLIVLIILSIVLLIYLLYERSVANNNIIISEDLKEGFRSNNKRLKQFKNSIVKKDNDFNRNNLKYYGYKIHTSNKKEDFIDTNKAKSRMDGSLVRRLKGGVSNRDKDREDFSNTKNANAKLERSKKLLERFREDNEEPGTKDNFQNVMDEIDKIDANAFTFNSIGSTISRYSDNLDNRIKHAKKRNSQSRLDSSMAQLNILWDEGKKLFLLKNVI